MKLSLFQCNKITSRFLFSLCGQKNYIKNFFNMSFNNSFYVFISFVDRDNQNTYKIFISIISLTALDMNDPDGYKKWITRFHVMSRIQEVVKSTACPVTAILIFQNIIGHRTNCIIIKIHSAIYQRTVFHISYVYN